MGRHPLPGAGRFSASASRAGIGPDTFVVAYDGGMDGGAARLWWLLRHFGHTDAAVLDGGIAVWRGELRGGEEEVEPGAFVAHERSGDTITAEELAARLDDERLLLLDARSPERYRGAAVIDPVGGRIPGALNVPYTDAAALSGDVLEAPELAVYCGSGVTACVNLLALSLKGRPDARLYPGSWSDWSSRGLPLERG